MSGHPEGQDAVRGYRIDYENVDVVDLVAQIRERVHRAPSFQQPPGAPEERLRGRLRTYLDLDDRRPFELQKRLALEGQWNVTPEDLRRSERRGVGRLIAVFRGLSRPFLKLLANLDLPFYKQFKVNLGVAEALHDLMQQTSELQARVAELSARVDRLERASSSEDSAASVGDGHGDAARSI